MMQNSLDEPAAPAPAEIAASTTVTPPARGRLAALRARLAPWIERLPGFGLWVLRVLVALAALTAIGTYVTLAVIHLRYPFEIEWMEGGLVDEVRRVLAGQKLYVKPTLDYVPYIYAPLWFYVAAVFAKIFGIGFFSARLTSFLASLVAIALIFRIVQREGRSRLAALLAAGLFTATYAISSAFFDIARVDSLFVALLLGGFYVLRSRSSLRSRFAAAALFTLAYLTKQSGLMIFAPIALHIFIAERWKRGLAFAFGGAAMMVATTLVLDRMHEGWFYYFVFWIPRQHPWVSKMWTAFWLEDLLAPVAISMVVALFHVTVDRGAEGRRFWAAALVGTLAASWVGRLHAGGWPNVIMPGFAMIATVFGLGLAGALQLAESLPIARRRSVEAFALALAAAQLAVLVYNPKRFIPTAVDRASGEKVLEAMRAANGDVWIPAHGHLASLVGKPVHAQEMAINDVIGMGGGKPGAVLRAEITKALAQKRFAVVISDTEFFRREIEQTYRSSQAILGPKDGYWPVTGMRARPKALYVPK